MGTTAEQYQSGPKALVISQKECLSEVLVRCLSLEKETSPKQKKSPAQSGQMTLKKLNKPYKKKLSNLR